MHTISHSIEIDAPLQMVYNQWTQFEEFPEFMEGVEEVRQHGDKRLHWIAHIGGKRYEWEAEIYEQIPDQRIAWRSVSGKPNNGVVRFDKGANNQTLVHLEMTYEPEGAMEKVGDALGIAAQRVKGDLKRFKEFVEHRGQETGAWRGEIHGHQVDRESGAAARSKRIHASHSKTGGNV